MATISYQSPPLIVGNQIYTWTPMAAGDDGQPAGATGAGDRTVQIQGAFGVGGTVLIEGTLDQENWFTLRDPTGSLLSFSAAGLKAVLENVLAIRPRVSAGDVSTAVTAIVSIRRDHNG